MTVISLHLENHGRNDIARLLKGEVSEGSVGNIIREYRRRCRCQGNSDIKSSEAEAEAQRPHPTQQVNQVNTSFAINNAYTADDNTIDLTGSLSLTATPPHRGDGLAGLNEPFPKNSGVPLQRFFPQITTTVLGYKDVAFTPPTSVKTLHEPTFVSNDATIAPDASEQVNIAAPVKENVFEEDTSFEENAQETQEYQHRYQPYPATLSAAQTSSRTSEDSETPTPTSTIDSTTPGKPNVTTTPVAPTPSATIESVKSSEMDWDDEDNWKSRFWRRISAEKKLREEQFSLIDKERELIARERHNLELEKQQLDYKQHDIETRIAEVEKYRDILPNCKQLAAMDADFHDIFVWIEVIRDKAAREGIDEKSAASLVVQDLKSYDQSNSLQNAVQRAQQDLSTLNARIEQKQKAIASLIALQSKGVSDTDLMELNALINSWSSNGVGGSQKENNGSTSNGISKMLRLDNKLNLFPRTHG
jgi:hypothetical protein